MVAISWKKSFDSIIQIRPFYHSHLCNGKRVRVLLLYEASQAKPESLVRKISDKLIWLNASDFELEENEILDFGMME